MTPSNNELDGNLIAQAKILIVDDNSVNVALLEALLRQAGAGQLVSTTDARRVLSIYLDQQPDLLILDLMMPYLDGFAVMEQLKPHIPANRYLPILMITAETSIEVRRRALASGAADFLTKPFDAVETRLRVLNLIEIAFLQRQLQSRVARDIHDGPLQDLSVLLLHIERCKREVLSGSPEAAAAVLGDLREEVLDTVSTLRGVIRELRPLSLSTKGLIGALEELSHNLQSETGAVVMFSARLDQTVDETLETAVYRLAQEALNNIRKHAGARHVWITLLEQDGQIRFTVRDDGQGFHAQSRLRQALASGHYGLAGLYERANAAGGKLTIRSEPGSGSTLDFVLPLGETAADR